MIRTSLMILSLFLLSLEARANTHVVCACIADYGLSFEVVGSVMFSIPSAKLDSEDFSDFADAKCQKKFHKQQLRAQNCQAEET